MYDINNGSYFQNVNYTCGNKYSDSRYLVKVELSKCVDTLKEIKKKNKTGGIPG